MRGHENDAAAVFRNTRRQRLVGKAFANEIMRGVDDGIARDNYVLRWHAFCEEVVARDRSWSKVHLRNDRGEPAVHFFWKWIENIAAAQARFDVRNRYAAIKSCKRSGECRGRVTLHHQTIELAVFEHFIHRRQNAARDAAQALVMRHEVQVDVSLKAEYAHDLVEHLAVLRRAD